MLPTIHYICIIAALQVTLRHSTTLPIRSDHPRNPMHYTALQCTPTSARAPHNIRTPRYTSTLCCTPHTPKTPMHTAALYCLCSALITQHTLQSPSTPWYPTALHGTPRHSAALRGTPRYAVGAARNWSSRYWSSRSRYANILPFPLGNRVTGAAVSGAAVPVL